LFASAAKLLTLSELARPSPWAEEARLLPWVEETRVMIGLSDRKTELNLWPWLVDGLVISEQTDIGLDDSS
jgi:hypothetical protein